MRWLHTEYVLKGIYLGFLVFVALQEPSWSSILLFNGLILAGLTVALVVASILKRREGIRSHGRLVPYLIFLLLESQELVYGGVLFGTALGALAIRSGEDSRLLFTTVGAGAALGLAFWSLQNIRNKLARLILGLALGSALVGGVMYWLGELGESGPQLALANPALFAVQLLLGIPVFYLLSFAGRAEETEVEVVVVCAALGLGLGILTRDYPSYRTITFVACIMVYFWYTTRVMAGLRVFKHALRGLSYAKLGRYRDALLSFRRALDLDPNNKLAREGFWGVHRAMDLVQLRKDPQTLKLIDFDLCLQRAAALLLESSPSPEKLQEANQLLHLIESQRPLMRPVVHYWRAVAETHARNLDQAATELDRVLDPSSYAANDVYRRSILYQAWQLGLMLHPELRRRVGEPQMALAGRRMEAIAAIERKLAETPDDADAWTLKRLLYSELCEAEYQQTAGNGIATEFDHAYVQQLGLALIPDPGRWQRGAEYLRLAGRGLPASAPSIFVQVAHACEKAGDSLAALQNYELAKNAGKGLGHKNLSEEERQTFFAAVKTLAEKAQARGDIAAAIENWELYTEFERSGMDTLRNLADLYEKRGDPLSALRITEQAMLYSGKDKDFLERKDRYYYSIMPEHLRPRLEAVRSWFDVGYCIRKARSLLDARNADLDTIDWANHLAELASVFQPDSLSAKVLLARAVLRRGERDEAVALLEQVRSPKPERFASNEEEDSWFLANRLLGEIYLYEVGRPDQAVLCFNDYRKSAKSGADTMYKLGQAYEQLGDSAKAAKCYEHVTAYEGHPLFYDARDALHRLQSH